MVFAVEMVTMGDAFFVQNDRRYTVRRGDVFLLRRGVDHVYETGPSGRLHKRFVMLGGTQLEPIIESLGLYNCDVICPSRPAELARILRRMSACLQHGSTHSLAVASGLSYRLLIDLMSDRKPAYPGPIRRALKYMDKHASETPTSAEIAKAAGVSITHLNRLFRRHLDTSPISLFLERRIRRAQALLTHTTLSIKEIANQVGCSDAFYFSAQFKKRVGVSPKRYRSTQS
jgi:AraC-like DNA-binding protein